MSKTWLKKIGYIDSGLRALASSSNQSNHLLVGVLGGLFDAAISLRVSVAFFATCLFEAPCGLLSDRIGHVKSVVCGLLLSALANGVLFLVFQYATSYTVSASLLVASALISAFSMALVSGSQEALLQDLIDFYCLQHDDEDSLRHKALLLSHKYGKELVSFAPAFTLIGLIVLFKTGHDASIVILVNGGLCLLFASILSRLTPTTLQQQKASYPSSSTHRLFKEALRYIAQDNPNKGTTLRLATVILITTLSMVHTHTYLMIAEFRNYDLLSANMLLLIPLIAFSVCFDVAHYIKGLISPLVANKVPTQWIIPLSYLSSMLLCVTTLQLYNLGWRMTALVMFALTFRSTLAFGQASATSRFLLLVPENLRAFFVSSISTLMLLLYGSYSLIVSTRAAGLGTTQTIIVEILLLSTTGLMFSSITVHKAAALLFKTRPFRLFGKN